MKQILIYGDSLSWGIIPGTRKRLSFDRRWPGVFESALLDKGVKSRVHENCINGRRTVWEDPFKSGRNGASGLPQVIEMHSPLTLVILMLGVNDFQAAHCNTPALSAMGSARLIDVICNAPVEPGMPVPEILVVAPPALKAAKGAISAKFSGAAKRSEGIGSALEEMAKQQGVCFFDSDTVVRCSETDGVHLDQDQHQALGEAIAMYVCSKILHA